jgi:hypothetical protein
MKHDIDYELTGNVNGASVFATGKGQADFNSGSYELEITCERLPLMWDSAFIILMTCDRFMGVCAKQLDDKALNLFSVGEGKHWMGCRKGAIMDADESERGSWESASVGYLENDVIISKSQIIESHFHLHPDERLKSIDLPFYGTMQSLSDNKVIVTTGYNFETTIGNKLHGFTIYPYIIPAKRTILGPQLLSVDKAEFTRKKIGKWGEQVHFRIDSSVKSLR